jgi:hypothetical protein
VFNLAGVAAMSQSQIVKLAIALGMVYGVYRFAPWQAAKAAALGVGGVILAKQLPYVGDSLA